MKIAVIGIGQTQFGELWNQGIDDLLYESQAKALTDANLKPESLNEIIVANMCAGFTSGQLNLGSLATELLGINIPSSRIEAACASGGLAINAGVKAILAGQSDVVMVSGVEKMTDIKTHEITSALATAAHSETESFIGATFPGLFAIITRMYMQQYNLTREDFGRVSVKNHFNGSLNKYAHLQRKITLEQGLSGPMVADPLSLFDCAPVSDGAASIILSTQDFAQKNNIEPVFIIGSGVGSDTLNLAHRGQLTSFKATQLATQTAFAHAKITRNDINIAEVHDAFTPAELIALEDIGFFEAGTAAHATQQGLTSLHGRLPINTSGGLKAKGHPVGATGISQAIEIVQQMRGLCGQRQVKNIKYGLTHNMGGIGATSVVHIFQNRD